MSERLIQVEERAKKLIQEHCPEYSFKWMNAKRTHGYCNYRKKTIALSKSYVTLNGDDKVNNTILHEIAHALAPRGAGHGPQWKAMARKLGAEPKRCATDTVTVPKTWEQRCKGPCDWTLQYFRKPKQSMFRVCKYCRQQLEVRRING